MNERYRRSGSSRENTGATLPKPSDQCRSVGSGNRMYRAASAKLYAGAVRGSRPSFSDLRRFVAIPLQIVSQMFWPFGSPSREDSLNQKRHSCLSPGRARRLRTFYCLGVLGGNKRQTLRRNASLVGRAVPPHRSQTWANCARRVRPLGSGEPSPIALPRMQGISRPFQARYGVADFGTTQTNRS